MAEGVASGSVTAMLEKAGAMTPDRIRSPKNSAHGGNYRLSETQAQAILDLSLHRLTGLEQDKILMNSKKSCKALKNFPIYLPTR